MATASRGSVARAAHGSRPRATARRNGQALRHHEAREATGQGAKAAGAFEGVRLAGEVPRIFADEEPQHIIKHRIIPVLNYMFILTKFYCPIKNAFFNVLIVHIIQLIISSLFKYCNYIISCRIHSALCCVFQGRWEDVIFI